jgi:hypothetical protein
VDGTAVGAALVHAAAVFEAGPDCAAARSTSQGTG